MIKWFFLYRVDTKTTGTAIAGQYYFSFLACPYKTQTLLTFVQFASTRAHITLNASIIQRMPESSVYDMLICIGHNSCNRFV
jgi:hypothetical protein